MEARAARDYETIRALTVPERASNAVRVLIAVDEFLAANEHLCRLVRQEFDVGLAQAIDQSARAYHLDIFSKYVELLDAEVSGDRATVSFTVDGRLPVRRAQLRQIHGTWKYEPGPGDYDQIARAFREMATGLRTVLSEIRGGRLGPDVVRDHPQRLIEEVRLHLLPGAKLLPEPPASGGGG